MKKLSLLVILCTVLSVSAQKRKHLKNDFTTEQKTQLRVKKLAIALDLNKSTTQQITPIIFNEIKERERNADFRKSKAVNKENMSANEKFKLAMDRLDREAELHAKMKSVLNNEQYKTWKEIRKNHHEKHNRKHLKKRLHKEERFN